MTENNEQSKNIKTKMKTTECQAPAELRRHSDAQAENLNGYNSHNITTICGRYTYEKPVSYTVTATAFGGWWGVAKFADGTTLKKFRGAPVRLIPMRVQ